MPANTPQPGATTLLMAPPRASVDRVCVSRRAAPEHFMGVAVCPSRPLATSYRPHSRAGGPGGGDGGEDMTQRSAGRGACVRSSESHGCLRIVEAMHMSVISGVDCVGVSVFRGAQCHAVVDEVNSSPDAALQCVGGFCLRRCNFEFVKRDANCIGVLVGSLRTVLLRCEAEGRRRNVAG